jgi:hypothetical protein
VSTNKPRWRCLKYRVAAFLGLAVTGLLLIVCFSHPGIVFGRPTYSPELFYAGAACPRGRRGCRVGSTRTLRKQEHRRETKRTLLDQSEGRKGEMSTSRWLTWTPPNSRIIEESLEPEPQNPQNPVLKVLQMPLRGSFKRLSLRRRRVSGTALRRSQMSAAGPHSRIARGLFAGVSLAGSTLRPDNDANKKLYGKEVSAKDVVFNKAVPAPPSAKLLLSMNRIKALYRSWGIPCSDISVYAPRHRAEWLAKIVEPGVRVRAERLYQQLDGLQPVRLQARRELLRESYKHPAVKLLRQIPSIGPIRSALLVALLQTPHRFRTKRQLWAYSGFAVETHDSGEYRYVRGKLQRNRERITVHGLNHNHNNDLKNLFKGAAISASTRPGPFRDFYVALLAKGIRPTMARLTLARKIATISLTIRKKGVEFDPQQLHRQAA